VESGTRAELKVSAKKGTALKQGPAKVYTTAKLGTFNTWAVAQDAAARAQPRTKLPVCAYLGLGGSYSERCNGVDEAKSVVGDKAGKF
jgi:hypothetical protein